VPDLPRAKSLAVEDLSIQHDASADALPHFDHDQVLHTRPVAKGVLAQGRHLRIVGYRDNVRLRTAQALLGDQVGVSSP